MKDYRGIEVGKMYDEYTEQERAFLPQLPRNEIKQNGKTPYMWTGRFWEYVMID